MKTFKDFLDSDNQKDIRDRFYKIIKKEPQSMRNLAKQIGIGTMTLIGFLKDNKNVDFVRLTKIENWINKKDK